ncbi:hypothetical protein [Flavobacterium granuli]|uniref:Immunity protein 51 n=1 Tax=Flavobacterium granuli TaxID=280093 RepID=A0ABU1S1I3_9FLAO|nr:hypothetical protein [Flavobacterium granuli]MDR6844515.1 hypothetical protein [Flavobacterium granuli]
MKIVDKIIFYNLPNGTLFSHYEPVVFNGLKIKGDTIYNGIEPIDYFYTDLIGNIQSNSSEEFIDKLDNAKDNSLELDFERSERDGLYEEDSLFAIYENNDLINFIKTLENCKKNDSL